MPTTTAKLSLENAMMSTSIKSRADALANLPDSGKVVSAEAGCGRPATKRVFR